MAGGCRHDFPIDFTASRQDIDVLGRPRHNPRCQEGGATCDDQVRHRMAAVLQQFPEESQGFVSALPIQRHMDEYDI